jgi:hypothetical protein
MAGASVTKPHRITMHAPKHAAALHVGEHELPVKDGKVEVPAEHVETAKAFGFSEHPHIESVTEQHALTLEELAARINVLEAGFAALTSKKGS